MDINDSFLTKNETKILKGIAIILMLCHHLWGFSDRIIGGNLKYCISLFGTPFVIHMASFANICVSFFFFLGGYGTFLTSEGSSFDLPKRIKKMYIQYWKVFLIFIPVAFLMFSKQPVYCENTYICNRYESLVFSELLGNLLGITVTYNYEWWFFKSYLIALVTFPFVRGLVKRFSLKYNVFFVIVGSILFTNVFPTLTKLEALNTLGENTLYTVFFCQFAPFISCFWMGIVAARNGLLNRIEREMSANGLLNPFIDWTIIIIVFYLRVFQFEKHFDIFFVPVLSVVCVDIVRRTKIINLMLRKIGERSTNMWLIHSFFCYYFYEIAKLVVVTRYAGISLLILLVLSYVASVAVDYIWNFLKLLLLYIRKIKE